MIAVLLFTPPGVAQEQTNVSSGLSLDQKEEFLTNGDVINEKFLSVGVTHSMKVTLQYNGMTHNAHVQTIDEKSSSVRVGSAPQIHDYYGFNIAAYELDRLLDLKMTPVSVKRKFRGKWAAFTWWVDDVAMMNLDRVRNKIEPPNSEEWNQQIYIVRIMNQLLYDTDPNMGNLLITKDWKVWTVDRTRAFLPYARLENQGSLTKCERHLLARLRVLNRDALQARLHEYLTNAELDGLDARRKLIVKFFDDEIAAKGEAGVLYDFAP